MKYFEEVVKELEEALARKFPGEEIYVERSHTSVYFSYDPQRYGRSEVSLVCTSSAEEGREVNGGYEVVYNLSGRVHIPAVPTVPSDAIPLFRRLLGMTEAVEEVASRHLKVRSQLYTPEEYADSKKNEAAQRTKKLVTRAAVKGMRVGTSCLLTQDELDNYSKEETVILDKKTYRVTVNEENFYSILRVS